MVFCWCVSPCPTELRRALVKHSDTGGLFYLPIERDIQRFHHFFKQWVMLTNSSVFFSIGFHQCTPMQLQHAAEWFFGWQEQQLFMFLETVAVRKRQEACGQALKCRARERWLAEVSHEGKSWKKKSKGTNKRTKAKCNGAIQFF